MTDDHIEPDHVVRTALRLLPVPDHHPDFWGRVSRSLDGEGPAERRVPLVAVPAPDVSEAGARASTDTVPLVELVSADHLGVVPAALRRRSNVVISAVAVAAAVMVVVAGTALVRDRTGGGGGTDVADRTEVTDGSAPTESTTATSIATLTTPGETAGADSASRAVLAWVAALGEGDIDAAWDALGPASKEHWTTKDSFAAQRTDLAEGYGAWSAAEPDTVLLTPLASRGDSELWVVTLVGTVQQEGTAQHRADAFPVRVVDGEVRLELYAFAGELEVVVPEPVPVGGTRPVVRDDELVVVVPDGVAPVLRLDDGEPVVCGDADGTVLAPLEGSTGQRCSYQPTGGIPAGDRVLTVAFPSSDGAAVTAQAVRFMAA